MVCVHETAGWRWLGVYGMGEYCRNFVSGSMPSPNSTQNETRETEKSWLASFPGLETRSLGMKSIFRPGNEAN